MKITVEDVTDDVQVRKAERVERDAQRRTDEDAAADRIRSYREDFANLVGGWCAEHVGLLDVCIGMDHEDCDHAVTNPDCEHYS